MRFESKLCHISENKAVVQVNGWLNDKNIGSSLAEGSSVELAEDKAISRLKKRLNIINQNEEKVSLINENLIEPQETIENLKKVKLEIDKENEEPTDWSNELIAIDSEIERLNWNRDDEIKFLEKNFGYNNRNKITKYTEIIKYLSILKEIDNDNTKTLIEESDVILKELYWDHKKGREYLKDKYNVSTRKELDKKQLISFVDNLKSIRNQNSLNKSSK